MLPADDLRALRLLVFAGRVLDARADPLGVSQAGRPEVVDEAGDRVGRDGEGELVVRLSPERLLDRRTWRYGDSVQPDPHRRFPGDVVEVAGEAVGDVIIAVAPLRAASTPSRTRARGLRYARSSASEGPPPAGR